MFDAGGGVGAGLVKQLTFEDRYDDICHWTDKRRAKWTLNAVPWEDARQMILIRVNEEYPKFDPLRGEFSHWLNRVISNKIKNIWRDNFTSYSRPCILGCAFNTGGTSCSKTSTGTQCAECPLYADWQKKKEAHFNVKQTLPIDSHVNEVYNAASDFTDVEAKKRVIDATMKGKLTRTEWKIYRLLYIKGVTEEDAAKAIGFKQGRGKKSKMFNGYSVILAAKHRIIEMAKLVIHEEDLA